LVTNKLIVISLKPDRLKTNRAKILITNFLFL